MTARPMRDSPACTLALLLAVAPCGAAADHGQVAFSTGLARVIAPAGRATPMRKGLAVNAGDLLRTGRDGRVQVRFRNGDSVSLSAGTDLRIDVPPSGTAGATAADGAYTLYRGAARFMTHTSEGRGARRLRVHTGYATLQTQGTEMALALGTGLEVKVGAGRVWIRNAAGALAVGPGQRAFVADRNAVPVIIGTIVPAPITPN